MQKDNGNHPKQVAIYCRVSSDHQATEGTSLDSQLERCLDYCAERGYEVKGMFQEVWSRYDLERPKFDRVKGMIRNREIEGVVCYVFDRWSGDPDHRVLLRLECEKYGVTLESVTQSIDLNTREGKLIDYIDGHASALERERILERTSRGTKQRVYNRKLPVTYREPYGYSWDKQSDTPRLVPNDNYATAELIIRLSQAGKSYDYIISELENRGILSPTGREKWNKHTISHLIRNPVYAGRYYAFKSEVVIPKHRRIESYGKSSQRRKPFDEWHHIPEITIENPILTWDEREVHLSQLKKRVNLASRNAKREYLLRSIVFCETHYGAKGKPRAYHGRPHHDSWCYTCPEGGCDTPHISGPLLENLAKVKIYSLFYLSPDEFYKAITERETREQTEESLSDELKKLKHKDDELVSLLTRHEDRFYAGEFENNEEVYERLKLNYTNKRRWIRERTDNILSEIAILNHARDTVVTFEKLREQFLGRIASSLEDDCRNPEIRQHLERDAERWGDSKEDIARILSRKKTHHEYEPLATSEWQDLFNKIGFEIHVHPNDSDSNWAFTQQISAWTDRTAKIECRMSMPFSVTEHDSGLLVEMKVNSGVINSVKDIALGGNDSGLRNIRYYPIRFSLSDFNVKEQIISILDKEKLPA